MSYHWQKTLISSSGTIKEAIEIINSESLGIALVVSEGNRLMGTITDGDIRRGLLREVSIGDCVQQVMNAAPVTAPYNTSNEKLLELMKGKRLSSVPLVDDEYNVVGLKTLHEAIRRRKYDNPVFIMSGGFGTRLKPLTDSCPKPMLKIGDKPILEIIMRRFIKLGFYNFYISTHYMAEKITSHFGDGEELGVNITYVHEQEPLGTGGALGLLPKTISNSPIIMINGDVLTNVDFKMLMDFHQDKGAYATMCVKEYNYQVPFGVIENQGNKIVGMTEKPVHHFFVNAGIYVVSPEIVDSVPKDTKIDMPSLLEQCLKKDKNVLMFPIHEYWMDVGRMDDFNRAQADIKYLDLE